MDELYAPNLPLHGVRVLDITVVWAGPHCTQLLAEWGAEVIRLEPLQLIQPNTRGAESLVTKEQVERSRGTGNLFLAYPDNDPGPRQWNRSPGFNSHARNKRSMTVNIATPEGRRVFLDMVAIADVVVENNVPETVERAGFTYADLAAANPRIIVLRMPSYGLSGPFKNYRSFGTHMEGMTGHHYLRSYPNLDPSMTGDAFTVDAASGVMGAFAVMMALRHRRRTGEGQHIEMAQAENFLGYLGEYLLDYSMNGRSPSPQGNRHPSHSPHGVYPCRPPTGRGFAPPVSPGPPPRRGEGGDELLSGTGGGTSMAASGRPPRSGGAGDYSPSGETLQSSSPPLAGEGLGEGVADAWIAIDIATDAEWEALCEVMGWPEWAADERFATTLGRWHHREELDRLLAGWTCTQDKYDLFHRLQEAGITAGPVQDEADAYACPQLNDRGFFEPLTHPEAGTYRYPGLNVRMAGTPNRLRRHPCLLGEDNEYVYHDLLDLPPSRYHEMEQKGHIGMDYPASAWAPPVPSR